MFNGVMSFLVLYPYPFIDFRWSSNPSRVKNTVGFRKITGDMSGQVVLPGRNRSSLTIKLLGVSCWLPFGGQGTEKIIFLSFCFGWTSLKSAFSALPRACINELISLHSLLVVSVRFQVFTNVKRVEVSPLECTSPSELGTYLWISKSFGWYVCLRILGFLDTTGHNITM